MKAALFILLFALPLFAQTSAPSSTNPPPAAPSINPVAAATKAVPLPSAAPAPPNPALDQPFYQACANGQLDQATALVAQGANINAPVGPRGYTPLMIAGAYKHWDVVQFLMAEGADLNLGSATGTHPLIFPLENGRPDIALAMVNAGANPNLCDTNYLLPIVYVARSGNIELMKAFIAHHADVNLNGADGPALYHAVCYGHPDIVQLLLDAGARVDIPSTTGGHSGGPNPSLVGDAALNDDLPMIDLLLAHAAPINQIGEDGETPLTEAILHSKPATIYHLIQKGADPVLADKREETPLMLAAIYGFNPDVMQALLDHGAKIEQANSKGWTPLIFAARHVSNDATAFFIAHGANVNGTDQAGETALRYAGDRGDSQLVDLIKAHGATRTDVHIIARPQDNPPLPPVQAFALAVGAMYAQYNGENPHVLGGATDDRPDEIRDELRVEWDVKDKASFLQALSDLHDHGFGLDYRTEGARVARMSDTQWQNFITAAPVIAVEERAIRASYLKWKERSGVAWDLCRYVHLVSRGCAAGYLSYGEALADIMPVAREIHQKFSSWQEMADNFLDGRTIWNDGPEDRFDNCLKLLLDPNEKESVWNQIPWNTDLGQ